MMFRLLGCSLLAACGATNVAWAQSGNNLLLPPNAAPDANSSTDSQERQLDPSVTQYDDDIEKQPEPYQYPQRHMFEQPVFVGADQLRLWRGYWQPGGYQVRDGSPFFHSVPGAPPRGPIAGGGGDSSYNPVDAAGGYGANSAGANGLGMGPQNQAVYQGGGVYGQPAYGAAGGYGGQYDANGYAGGYGAGYNTAPGNYAGGAGGGGAGGDPYGYHFGPGYYRSGEYGHFRFPYYSYRRPWYHPGFAGFNRDVNLPW